jgi:hypothetical protein
VPNRRFSNRIVCSPVRLVLLPLRNLCRIAFPQFSNAIGGDLLLVALQRLFPPVARFDAAAGVVIKSGLVPPWRGVTPERYFGRVRRFAIAPEHPCVSTL